MQTRIRSLKDWEKLDINHIERRKILCSVMFHTIVITCVVWSLYVLVERTAQDMNSEKYDWAFWVKLVVVAIGFTVAIIFMYIQCKMYVQLCMRWRRYNRVIIIQPITEELVLNNTNMRRVGKTPALDVNININELKPKAEVEEISTFDNNMTSSPVVINLPPNEQI